MTPDLDALDALLAAATPVPLTLKTMGDGSWYGYLAGNHKLLDAAVNALPELIAAARRDARPRWHHDWDLPPEDRHYCEECASLIEAARREAGLVEALSVVEGLIAIRENDRLSGDDCYEQTEDMPIFAREAWNAAYDLIEARDRAMTTARALLHDNAGAALPAEGTE